MARTPATLSEGARVTDYISLGVVAEKVPRSLLDRILEETGKQSQRQRRLPAHVVMYYVIALALFMNVSYGEVLRCLVEALRWLGLPVDELRRTGKSGISQARSRLGPEPMRLLYEEIAKPVAQDSTQGAWYREWRLVAMDGTTLDVADEKVNAAAFGRPGTARGKSGFPQVRLVSLVECGTHVLFGAAQGPYSVAEKTLACDVVSALKPRMLCSADRGYFSYDLWSRAAATGADLLWRLSKHIATKCEQRLADGSYLTSIYPSQKDRKRKRNAIKIRVIEYALEGIEGAEPVYRLASTILDVQEAPAAELAALYHERWEIENAFDELKIHLRGPRIVLRSKTPELVIQELYGLLIAHFVIRALMHEAAQNAKIDTDALSFVHAVRVLRRHAITAVAFPPSEADAPSRSNPGGDP